MTSTKTTQEQLDQALLEIEKLNLKVSAYEKKLNKVQVNRGPLRIAMFLSDGNVFQVKRLIIQSSLGLTDNPIIPKEIAEKYRKYTWDQLWTKYEEDRLIRSNKSYKKTTENEIK